MASSESYEGWAILELMGHRRMAGLVGEAKVGGATVLRIDVPGEGDELAGTQFYNPSALYCLTPTTEDVARILARRWGPSTPVQPWELAPPSRGADVDVDEDLDELDDDDVDHEGPF